ncbi:MAG: DUF1801 domain-containing protein [Phycisphaera sp.]|nr:DUF1801 domain-containing protein [Phycisphaera sp.]
MAEAKTRPTGEDVDAFVDAIDNARQRDDTRTLIDMMKKITKHEPKIWASSMIGFGDDHYRYASGREGDIFLVGFAPRKGKLVLYLACSGDRPPELMAKLGKFKTGVGCLYITRLDDVHLPTLRRLIAWSAKQTSSQQPRSH